MILVETNKPGRLWLIAMFKFYCKKHGCTFIAYPGGKFQAVGANAKKAHYDFEIATGKLLIRIINALAGQEKVNHRTVSTNTTRDFVKELYKEKDV